MEYAFCRPCEGETSSGFVDEQIELYGERYGGPGLAGNGGGVRCGILGDVQIKGSGQNSLAGTSTDHWHKHGACSLQDCIKETIWGEILNCALPFGAARTYAIIDTGTEFSVEVGEWQVPGFAKRALLLREPVMRPAHFMRSAFFSPSPEFEGPTSDVKRTIAAICSLPTILTNLLGKNELNHSSEIVGLGLIEVFRRAACQIATSRAKRIIHGSLIASNFSIDGRWLDFGTVSALSGYGRAIVAPGSTDFWGQQSTIIETIRDITFYCSKFLPSPFTIDGVELGDRLTRNFLATLDHRTKVEFIKLTGVPESALSGISNKVIDDLWEVMSAVLKATARRPYLYFGDDRHLMPEDEAKNSLTAILIECSLSSSAGDLSSRLSKIGVAGTTLEQLPTKYWNFRREVRDACSVEREIWRFNFAFAIRGIRANWPNSPLHRQNLDLFIDKLSRSPELIAEEMSKFICYWTSILNDRSSVALDDWLLPHDECVVIDEQFRVIKNGRLITKHETSDMIGRFSIAREMKEELSSIIHNSIDDL